MEGRRLMEGDGNSLAERRLLEGDENSLASGRRLSSFTLEIKYVLFLAEEDDVVVMQMLMRSMLRKILDHTVAKELGEKEASQGRNTVVSGACFNSDLEVENRAISTTTTTPPPRPPTMSATTTTTMSSPEDMSESKSFSETPQPAVADGAAIQCLRWCEVLVIVSTVLTISMF